MPNCPSRPLIRSESIGEARQVLELTPTRILAHRGGTAEVYRIHD